MSLEVVTPPYAAPLHLAEVKLSLKQDVSDDDSLIASFMQAARRYAEHETRNTLVATTYRQVLDAFPCFGARTHDEVYPYGNASIELERRPVLEVVSVQYVDFAGVTQMLDPAAYLVSYGAECTRIAPAWGLNWPSTRRQLDAVTVTFIAGHAAPVIADAAADTVTVRGWKALAVDDVLRFTNSGGALPAPLAADTDYFVKTAPGAGVYTLALTAGGAAIDITGAGTGLHYLGEVPDGIKSWMRVRIGGLDQNRQEMAADTLATVPFFDRLLDPFRAYGH